MSAVTKIKFQNISLNLFAWPCIWYRTRNAAAGVIVTDVALTVQTDEVHSILPY